MQKTENRADLVSDIINSKATPEQKRAMLDFIECRRGTSVVKPV